MSRYIDAELAVKHIEEMTLEHERMQSNFSANWMIDFLEAFPRADVEPVRHGHWIKVFPRRTNRNATYKCSVCKKLRSSYYNDVAEWDHCPCGAKMDGKENE